MTAEPDLLPLPEPHWIGMDTCDLPGPRHYIADQMHAYARANVAHAVVAKDAEIARLQEEIDNRWAQGVHTCNDNCQRVACVQRREIEALRADKSDLEAALEAVKAHQGNAIMSQRGIINALSEARDELGAEIHKLRAELEIAKGQAEFYRTERNKNQRKAERLAEALRDALECGNDGDWQSARQYITAALAAQPGGSDNDR